MYCPATSDDAPNARPPGSIPQPPPQSQWSSVPRGCSPLETGAPFPHVPGIISYGFSPWSRAGIASVAMDAGGVFFGEVPPFIADVVSSAVPPGSISKDLSGLPAIIPREPVNATAGLPGCTSTPLPLVEYAPGAPDEDSGGSIS